MNKTFTLAALGLLLAVSANAQKVRKTWDFRDGFSSATVANLYADMEQTAQPHTGATGKSQQQMQASMEPHSGVPTTVLQ